MLSDNSNSNETNKKPTKPQSKITPGVPPPEQEHLPCPRCSSTNTKFCYYNNYNFSQPRHFCKSCRRYWTQGGTLRDIPVGGGTRKTAKRSRTSAASSLTVGSVSAHDGIPLMTSPILMQLSGANVGVDGGASVCGGGSFTSLLNTQGHGLLSIGGLGLGIGSGLEDMGFGFGRGVWSLTGLRDGGVGGDMSDTWQLESTENGFVGVNGGGGDCFSWPDLAISTPGNVLK